MLEITANNATATDTVLDVLSGRTAPKFDFNFSVENDTIIKMIGAGIVIALVAIILNVIVQRLI